MKRAIMARPISKQQKYSCCYYYYD
jgi:hypothetical protein